MLTTSVTAMLTTICVDGLKSSFLKRELRTFSKLFLCVAEFFTAFFHFLSECYKKSFLWYNIIVVLTVDSVVTGYVYFSMM